MVARAANYLLATVVLAAGLVHQISYNAGMLFQIAADIPGAAFDPFEPFIVGLFATGGGLLLANLRPATPETPAPSPDRTRRPSGRDMQSAGVPRDPGVNRLHCAGEARRRV